MTSTTTSIPASVTDPSPTAHGPVPADPTPAVEPDAGGTAGLQRAGALAAAVKAATYLVGFVVLGAYLVPAGFGEGGPDQAVEFLVDHQSVLYAWHVVLYLVGGAALVVLTLGVHDRLAAAGESLRRTATAFGLIWSGLLLAAGMIALVGQQVVVDLHADDPERAATVWAAVSAVQDGLGGGIEVVGAIWIGAVSVAALRTGVLGRALVWLGLVVAAAGALTVVPGLEAAAALFGLGFVAWFIGVASTMRHRSVPAPDPSGRG